MDASAQKTTVRQVLTQQKPFVPCEGKVAGGIRPSRNHLWPELQIENVTIWEDFNLETLSESYDFILDRPVPKQLLISRHPDQALAGVVVGSAKSANRLIAWNDEQMRVTLGFVKGELGLRANTVLCHSTTAADGVALATLPHWNRRLAVDHAITLEGGGCKQSLVVGIGKISSVWNSGKITHRLGRYQPTYQPTKADIWVLRQLANTCMIADTRYGYIQTDNELVVCRFATKYGVHNKSKDNWRVAIMNIPWSASGAGMLTTELALWWLCMLAMAQSATITDEDNMVSINSWDTIYADDERGWVRRHQYSNFEVPTTAPPPPAYKTPSPTNEAAFAAAVGLHALPEFEIYDFNAANAANYAANNPNEMLLNGLEGDYEEQMDWNVVNFDLQ